MSKYLNKCFLSPFMTKKILFFKLGAIGDTLMTTPLVRQVCKAFPSAQIDYLIGNHSAGVLKNNKNITTIIPFDEKIFIKKKIISLFSLIKKVRLEKYDLIFVLDKHWIFNVISFFFGIPMRVGFDRLGREGFFLTHKVLFDSVKPEILYYLDLAKSFGISINEQDVQMDIAIGKNEKKFAQKFFKDNNLTKNTIGICPGGGVNPGQLLDEKIWPVEKYAKLIKKIKKVNVPILLLGGKTDSSKEQYILEHCGNITTAVGKTNLQESAALMQLCKGVICNDSGPMHIAAASKTKVLSLFGPTDPRRLAPLGKRYRYIWKHGEPCYSVFGKMKKKDHVCLETITVQDVFSEMKFFQN